MLRPVIMIGCGGSGQKAVRYVRDAVRRQLEHFEWDRGMPRAWQFIALDTVTTQESPGEIPTMPASDYISVALSFGNYQALEGALLTQFPPGSRGYNELMGWRPAASEISIPLTSGAGQIRAVGRAAGVLSLASVVRPRLQHAFTECAGGIPELQELSQHLQVPVPAGTASADPIVVVLGSNAGGTGAGIMLDVVDLVRRTHSSGAFPIAVVFSSDIFGQRTTPTMAANGLAFMSELMSAYWDNELSGSDLIPSLVATSNRGPHSVFMVGRKNIDSIDLGDSRNVYRAVGEALASWVTSSQIQTDLNNFIVTNWGRASVENRGGYPFAIEHQRGVVSSFGSATISIGRDRFRDYATKLLVRQVVEFLDHGHLLRKNEFFGEQAEGMTPPAVLAGIVRQERENFFVDAGIHERGDRNNQISDVFVGVEVGKTERAKIVHEMSGALQTSSLPASQWMKLVLSQMDLAGRTSQTRAAHDFDLRVGEWSPKIFERILRTTSEYAARFGLAVTVELVRAAQTELHEVAAEVRHEGRQGSEGSILRRDEIARSLPESQRGTMQFQSDGVQKAIEGAATSLILHWRSETLSKVARLMEDVADQVLRPLANSLMQAQQRVHFMVTGSDGDPALIESWPEDNNTVPISFAPSPVEFFLEAHTTWPGKLRDLLGRSLPPPDPSRRLPTQPVRAVRHLLIADEFASTSIGKVSRPLVWTGIEFGGHPQWGPGGAVSIEVRVDEESLFDRVRDWMMQPATALESFLREGLRSYLSEVDSNGNSVPDHLQRLSTFRQRLGETLKQSRPLFEVNSALMARVHPQYPMLNARPIVQGFPFPEGHPARTIVEELLRQRLEAGTPVDSFFSNRDSESVLVSSFIEHPVHPMVITSFTSPINVAMSGLKANPAMLRGSFWQWAWTKVLEDAIPLPDPVRLAMVRGFAVARLLGVMTADPSKPIEIGTADGEPLTFPAVLLTETSAENLLPALLESFVLCFGEVDTKQEKAFDAYKALWELGVASGERFSAKGHLLDFIMKGSVPSSMIVDRARYESMVAGTAGSSAESDVSARVDKMLANLDQNRERYVNARSLRPTGQEHRTTTGSVIPEITLSIQLLDDLETGYEQVKAAIRSASVGSAV